MKKLLTILGLFLFFVNTNAQSLETLKTDYDVEANKEDKNQKIYFIVGIGGSYIANNLYQNPSVNLSNKNVILEDAQNIKTNISLGIAYTGSSLRLRDGTTKVPYGLTFATFINPITLNQVSDNQGFFNMVDFETSFRENLPGCILGYS